MPEDLAALRGNSDATGHVQRDPAAVADATLSFIAAHSRVRLLAKEPASMLVRQTTALIISKDQAGIPP
jgi:hypothetical protein